MGTIATDNREINLYYNAETNKGMQTLAYLESSEKKVLAIDLSKTKVTGTQWLPASCSSCTNRHPFGSTIIFGRRRPLLKHSP